MGSAFQAQKELLGGGGAVDERAAVKPIKTLDVVTILALSVAGVKRPCGRGCRRANLWMCVRKHAKGARALGSLLWRK